MGKLKGQAEADAYAAGDRLTLKQSVKAQCYVCNGQQEDGSYLDCQGNSCPLYPWAKKWIFRKPRSGAKGEVPLSGERNSSVKG